MNCKRQNRTSQLTVLMFIHGLHWTYFYACASTSKNAKIRENGFCYSKIVIAKCHTIIIVMSHFTYVDISIEFASGFERKRLAFIFSLLTHSSHDTHFSTRRNIKCLYSKVSQIFDSKQCFPENYSDFFVFLLPDWGLCGSQDITIEYSERIFANMLRGECSCTRHILGNCEPDVLVLRNLKPDTFFWNWPHVISSRILNIEIFYWILTAGRISTRYSQ